MVFSMLSRTLVLRRWVLILLAGALAWALQAPAWAEVWKYVDGKGVTHFTNQPPPPNAQQLIPLPPSLPSSAVRASVPATVPVPPAAPASAAKPLNPAKALGDWPPRPFVPIK